MLITSILNYGTNAHLATAEEANLFNTLFILPGVVGSIANTSGVAPMTGAFGINAQGTPNNTVTISASGYKAVVATTPLGQNLQNLITRGTADITITIAANTSGATKYDWIYLVHDATAANNPDVGADNVASIVVNRGTSNTSDSVGAPANSLLLGFITVASGFTSITNGNITDKRVQASAAIPDGSIGNSKLAINAPWTSWTPTWSNATVGNGTVTAKYQQVGKTVNFRVTFTLGSTSSIGTGPGFTLPMPAVNTYGQTATGAPRIGIGSFEDNGVTNYGLRVLLNSTTVANLGVVITSNAYETIGGITSTTPFTAGVGDEIICTGSYEAA